MRSFSGQFARVFTGSSLLCGRICGTFCGSFVGREVQINIMKDTPVIHISFEIQDILPTLKFIRRTLTPFLIVFFCGEVFNVLSMMNQPLRLQVVHSHNTGFKLKL